MSDVDEKVIGRIRKLFALSESPNENEAALALERAHELLAQYNLEMVDLVDGNSGVIEEELESGSRRSVWRTVLVHAICEANYCAAYVALSYRQQKQVYSLRIAGRKHNVQSARVMIDYLVAAVERLAKLEPVAVRDTFRKGISHSLSLRLRALKSREAADGNVCRDLVVREDAAIKAHLGRKNVQTKKETMKLGAGMAEFRRGADAGNSISLDRQVDSP